MPFQLRIPSGLYDQMIGHAQAELPNECCGFLAGRIEAEQAAGGTTRVGLALKRYALVNALASPVEYLAEPRGLLDAARDMRDSGIDPLAIYHSHPSTDPVPSRKDLEQNFWEGVVHLIISWKSRVPRVRGWWLNPQGYSEAEWTCED